MAKTSADLVSVGKPSATGAVYAAPVGTALPTDSTKALASAYVALGHVSGDGLTNTVETDTEDIKAWGGDTVLTVRTSRSETFAWTFIHSLDADVLKEVYGQSNVTTSSTGEITVKHNGTPVGRRTYVFDMLLTGGRAKRIVVPNAEITEVGDITYTDGEVVGYEVTLSAFPDANGDTAVEYVSKPTTSSAVV